MTAQPDNVRAHIWVKGRVQGVGFRAFVQQNAVQIGVSGWVRNVSWDTVETVAEGEKERVERFLDTVKRGPTASRVDDSRVEWENSTGEFRSFSVKSSL